MPRKLKLLFLLIPLFILAGCGNGEDPIFDNLDASGKLIYLVILIALGLLFSGISYLFKKAKKNKTQQPPPFQQQPPPFPGSKIENTTTEPPREEQKDKV